MRATSRVMNTIYVEPTQKYPWVGIWDQDSDDSFKGRVVLFTSENKGTLLVKAESASIMTVGTHTHFIEKHYKPFKGTIELVFE